MKAQEPVVTALPAVLLSTAATESWLSKSRVADPSQRGGSDVR